MKFITSAFKSDELYLSRWDLIKLFFGKTYLVFSHGNTCRGSIIIKVQK